MTSTALGLAIGWISLLFLVAFLGDRQTGRRSNPAIVYTLSLAVYCTTWTFYGSVGLAARSGLSFLAIYLGPTLIAVLFPLFMPRFIALCQRHRVSSVPDFLAARYGKSAAMAALATVVVVIGVVPYIALQLKAVDMSFRLLTGSHASNARWWADTGLWIAGIMAVFAIMFGTRSLQVTEQHRGMVWAIALESAMKLAALLLVGGFVLFVVLEGGGGFVEALHTQEHEWFQARPTGQSYTDWFVLLLLAMSAVVLLPRQFHMLVVENTNVDHARTAAWSFPLYLFLINLAVLPIAIAGMTVLPNVEQADTWVLALPIHFDQPLIALVVFLGGLSAATGMIIVESTALATMISNDLALPLILRGGRQNILPQDLGQQLLRIRRFSMVAILLLGYIYITVSGERSLVSMGLVSFAAVAQFVPGVLLGLTWRGVNGFGAGSGLSVGFLLWAHCLFLPSVWPAYPELFPALLNPTALLGYSVWDPLSHGVIWSLGLNAMVTIALSLWREPSGKEVAQAEDFVNSMRGGSDEPAPSLWRGGVAIADLERLLRQVLGEEKTRSLLTQTGPQIQADGELLRNVESELAAAVGSASARILVSSVATAHEMSQDEVFRLMAETSGALKVARQLKQKSDALEKATRALKAANLRLRELDRLKDDFVSTVTHELRTPITSIRAFTEIMRDDSELDTEERSRFLQIVIDETDRLSRLIEQVLELSKLESGAAEWQHEDVDVHGAIERALGVMQSLAERRAVQVSTVLDAQSTTVSADQDRLQQVLVNLIANALKFCPETNGRLEIRTRNEEGRIVVMVSDNGPGISGDEQSLIFDRFRQARRQEKAAKGTGLGLAISKQIVEHLGGSIWVHSTPGWGAQFSFALPLQETTRT